MTIAKIVTKTLDVGVKDTKINLSATIKSYDLTDTKFIFNIISNQGLTIDLTGSTAIYIVEYAHNSQTYAIQGKVDIIDSTTIAFSLPEDLKGYNGTVLIGLYVQMTDGTKIDIKDIIVRIEPSIIDKDIDFSARTYFEDFETVKAEVISEGENAKTEINAVVTDVQSVADKAKTEINTVPPTVTEYANTQKQAINSAVSDVNGYADSQKQAIHNIVADVQSTGDTAKADINATLPTLQTQVSELSESITDISDELNNLIVTVFPQKESTRDKWNFYIINHTFETDSKIVISTSGINYGINYMKNGAYINVADYGITQDSVITVSKGDRIDVIQVVTFGDCTLSCKIYGDKVKKETIPDGLIIHNYGTIVKQYYYGLKYNPSSWGGRFKTDNAYFITNPLPIIKDKNIYIDSTYTAHALFYDENGEYLGYKELYYGKPLLYSDISENAYYICFSLMKNSPNIENGDTAKLNTNTFDNRYMRRTVSERNYMKGTRLKTYIYNTDSIETIVHKMNEALATENVDVYWEHGTYNLNGLYNVLQNSYRFAGQIPRGIYIGGNCRYYFNNALLTKDMSDVPSGSNYSSDILEGVKNDVASNCDYEIYDLNIHGTGIIYCVHDDVGTSTIIPTYRKYVNCKMRYTATESSQYLSKCIGGGTGRTTYREIDNCSFFMNGESTAINASTRQEVSFHGSSGDTEEGYFQLKVHDCYFENSIGLHSLDTNQKADFYMNNCSLGRYTKSSDEKWKSYVWNNEIRG